MKESIYMIPLNDSFDQTDICPFCFLEQKTQSELLDYCMGPSMMEPDSRIKSNETGFCRNHLDQMFSLATNKLSLALMLSTHVEYVENEIKKLENAPSKNSLFKKSSPDLSNLEKCTSSCLICNRIKAEIDRYADTFFYMYKKTPEFRSKVETNKNICISHGMTLLKADAPNKSEADELLLKIMRERLSADKDELLSFIDMFDYRKKVKNPGAHKNALRDAIAHLRSKI